MQNGERAVAQKARYTQKNNLARKGQRANDMPKTRGTMASWSEYV
jgi:hypothetical protein